MEEIIHEDEYEKVIKNPDASVRIIRKKEKETGKISWWFRISKKRWFEAWDGISIVQRAILLSLWLYAGKGTTCYPSIRELAERLKLSTCTINKNIKKLEKSGFIRIEKQKGRGRYFNKYFLLK